MLGRIVVAVLAFVLVALPDARAATLPPGFTDELVTALGAPTALAFTPDARLLATTQGGQLHVVTSSGLQPTAALNLSSRICANSERGLLGVAVDPSFATNHFVYLFWTWKKHGVCEANTANAPVNRVARYVLGDNNLVDPVSELVLVDNMPSPAGNHNAGDLGFGKDGNLYVTIGDGGCDYAGGGCAGTNDASRDQHVLTGKVLRITRDGAVPAGNPFVGADSAVCAATGRTNPGKKCRETFAWGLRNPFRFAFDPNAATTRFYVNDVGQGTWEEIDLGQSGADYGWNVREGFCANGSTSNCGAPPPGMTNPIFAYGRADGCASITGGAFVPNGVWPAEYDGKYLFADYVCGAIFRLDPADGGGFTRTPFVTGLGGSSAVHMTFGPAPGGTRALYYTTYASGGQVHRIRHTGANGVPTASFTASPPSGPAPVQVSFDGSASSDPEAESLTYLWAFGDGATATTTGPTTAHRYAANGTYTASLQVRDARGAVSAPATRTVAVGNTPPAANITSPPEGTTFAVGDTVTVTGTATDAQDGTLSGASLAWTALLHHNGHTHPLDSGNGGQLTLQAPPPEDLAATAASFVEVLLTATDSGGLTSTVSRSFQPRRVPITFVTSPPRLVVLVNGFVLHGGDTSPV